MARKLLEPATRIYVLTLFALTCVLGGVLAWEFVHKPQQRLERRVTILTQKIEPIQTVEKQLVVIVASTKQALTKLSGKPKITVAELRTALSNQRIRSLLFPPKKRKRKGRAKAIVRAGPGVPLPARVPRLSPTFPGGGGPANSGHGPPGCRAFNGPCASAVN